MHNPIFTTTNDCFLEAIDDESVFSEFCLESGHFLFKLFLRVFPFRHQMALANLEYSGDMRRPVEERRIQPDVVDCRENNIEMNGI